jgi:asparaginyl-tRNA synthetase
MQVYIEDIGRHIGNEVIIKGWLYNKRSSGKLWFLLIRDGTGIIQTVISQKDVGPQVFAAAEKVTQESSLVLRGTVREDKRAPGGHEIITTDLTIVQLAQEYPISHKEHGTEFLMAHRHLWLRSRRQHALLRCRDTMIRAFHDFFGGRGFVLIDPPIITPTSCEGASELFEVQYFGDKAYLSQSGQLYMEPAAAAFGKVYCLAPSFRAEKSKTRRHLTEFWHLEPEVAFMDLDGVMELAEDMLVFVVRRILEERPQELGLLGEKVEGFDKHLNLLGRLDKPFARISYTDAVTVLNKKGMKMEWGVKFGADEEAEISRLFEKPVFVHRYPKASAPFYMKEDPGSPEVVRNFDLLAPEGYGEIIGGSQREDDLAKLEAAIVRARLPREPLEWYLDLRRYGTFEHSGFGIGMERTLAWITGIHHVRETIPYPRLLEKLYP